MVGTKATVEAAVAHDDVKAMTVKGGLALNTSQRSVEKGFGPELFLDPKLPADSPLSLTQVKNSLSLCKSNFLEL